MSARLSLSTPIASLLEAAGVTRSALADKLDVRRESVRDGDGIKLSTLVRAAEALGYEVEVRVLKKPAGDRELLPGVSLRLPGESGPAMVKRVGAAALATIEAGRAKRNGAVKE